VGRLGLTSPRSPVLCLATTAPCPSQVASLIARSPIPYLLPWFVFLTAREGAEALSSRRGSWSAGTPALPAPRTRRHLALPSSRVPPLTPCPALRPRWSPAHLPYRRPDCCLPLVPPRRLWLLSLRCTVILLSTTILISGLYHAAWHLAPSGSVLPLRGLHAEVTTPLLARRWGGGT
jgi:hypothetical protein